ncbi:hypothetical protein BG011_002367 [Mortierella polycephala]|uniref:Uncharacterized protein n=1 Tax=Mortierella polycephala TaxID=41804 RepID=A0A9P6U458_9FUNG|nr:hypothetical protein BG011_002367 [Mortierella polycephala]
MTGTKKNIFWKMAIGLIIIYGIVAAVNIGCYIEQKVIYNHISGPEVRELQLEAIRLDLIEESVLKAHERFLSCAGETTLDRLEIGVPNWNHLIRVEKDLHARPLEAVYILHQMLMLLTCGWVSVYLFIPLVRHHRRGPIGKPVDSDMLAVGVWYLTCIMSITVAYATLNIYFCFSLEHIFLPQAQALDLSLRSTIASIFILPAPPLLIRFYRQRFRSHSKGTGSFSGGGGMYLPRERFDSTGSNMDGPGSFSNESNIPYPFTMEGSWGGNDSHPQESIDNATKQGGACAITYSNTNRDSQSTMAATRLKLFHHTRNRGASMESSKVFNQDFEPEEQMDIPLTPDDSHRSDLFDQYTNMDVINTRSQPGDSTIYQIPTHTLGNEKDNYQSKIPLAGHNRAGMGSPHQLVTLSASNTTATPLGTAKNQGTLTEKSSKDVIMPKGIIPHSLDRDDNRHDPASLLMDANSRRSGNLVGGGDVVGSTGWEMGGWGHIRQTTDGNENSLSHPLEQPYPSVPPSPSPSPSPSPRSMTRDTRANRPSHPSGERVVEHASPHHGLTGLQKQLAEYQSALLPGAIAMQEGGSRGPPSVTFDSRDGGDSEANESRGNSMDGQTRRPAARGRRDSFILNDAPPLDQLSFMGNERQCTATASPMSSDAIQGTKDSTKQYPGHLAHSVDSLHWSKGSTSSAPGRKVDYADGAQNPVAQGGFHPPLFTAMTTEKPITGFKKKWLAGRRSNEPDRVLPSKKFEMDYSQATTATSGNDIKASKYNSGGSITGMENSQPAKGSRLGMFSKVLSGAANKGTERSRQSHGADIDKEAGTMDSSNKTMAKSSTVAHAAVSVPATVEALALASTRSHLDDEDEDKGLQYYYPDPYSSFVEFKRPQRMDQAVSPAAARDRTASLTAPARHPLTPTFPNDRSGPSAIRGPNARPIKGSQASKKSPRSDASASSPQSNYTNTIPSPTSGPPHSSSLGSLLSRSASGSKRLGSKVKARGSRSKSDVAPSRTSLDGVQSPTTALPITATRKPSIPAVPAISQPTQTSLSPPPRQSWMRSKSFQGPTSAASALLLYKMPGNESEQPMSINTQLANEHGAVDMVPSSSGTRSSLASSLGSPTMGSLSPTLSATNEGPERAKRNSPSSPVLSPSTSAFTRLGGLKPRHDYRHNSFDRESEHHTDMGGNGKERTGFSTAAMDRRRASNRHQQSIDNLASAYYYKRASELNNHHGETGSESMRDHHSLPSIDLSNSGFSYYGSGGMDSGRCSPTPRNQSPNQSDAQSGHRDSLNYRRPSSSSNRYTPQSHQRGKASLDYSIPESISPVMNTSSASGDSATNENGRTESLTNNMHLMGDDPWTQALIARAQGGGGSGSHQNATGTSPQSPNQGGSGGGGYQILHQQGQHARATSPSAEEAVWIMPR